MLSDWSHVWIVFLSIVNFEFEKEHFLKSGKGHWKGSKFSEELTRLDLEWDFKSNGTLMSCVCKEYPGNSSSSLARNCPMSMSAGIYPVVHFIADHVEGFCFSVIYILLQTQSKVSVLTVVYNILLQIQSKVPALTVNSCKNQQIEIKNLPEDQTIAVKIPLLVSKVSTLTLIWPWPSFPNLTSLATQRDEPQCEFSQRLSKSFSYCDCDCNLFIRDIRPCGA